GGTILRTSGWKIDIRWAAIMATLHGPCWLCCRSTMRAPALGSAMVRHGLAPGSRNGPTRAVLAVSRAVLLGTNRRPTYGHGNRLNTTLTSPPRLAFLRPAQSIRPGAIWQELPS